MKEITNHMPKEYLFLDTETTGLYPEKHGIVQVAAVCTDEKFTPLVWFKSYVRPSIECEVSDEALEIHGLTRKQIATFPREHVVFPILHAWIVDLNGPIFAGYNAAFDLKMMAAAWQRNGLEQPGYKVPAFCLMEVAKKKLPKLPQRENPRAAKGFSTHRLVDVMHHFEMPIEGAHDAMFDILSTIEIARRLHAPVAAKA